MQLELSWVSVLVASRGLDESHHLFKEPVNPVTIPVPNSGTFLSVGTKQQSRLKYSHSLMSISLLEAAAWPLSVRQLEGRCFQLVGGYDAGLRVRSSISRTGLGVRYSSPSAK